MKSISPKSSNQDLKPESSHHRCGTSSAQQIKNSAGPIHWEYSNNSLQLSGPLVRTTVAQLLPHISTWQGVCCIDLKNVSDIDSAGLALLAQAVVSVCSNKPCWRNASAKTIALSELYGLDQFINLE